MIKTLGGPKTADASESTTAAPAVSDTTALVNVALVLATAAACYALGRLVSRISRHGAS